jgi:hypothetical protein
MHIPNVRQIKRVRGVRFLLATAALIVLYTGLDSLAFWLFQQGTALQSATALGLGAAQAEIDAVARASAPREAALPPAHRLAAFDLGLRMGVAAAMAGQATAPHFSAAQREEALREAQAFLDEGGLAQRLLGTRAQALRSRNFGDWSGLPQRIEADESGLAARIEAASTPRHRHLFMLGMQVGRTVCVPKGVGDLLGEPLAGAVALHASLAGLPKRLWEPLVQVPRAGTASERRVRYEAAVEAVRQALWTNPPWR